MAWGALLGAGLQAGGSALTAHLGRRAADRAMMGARTLRRSAYQDTVFDLRKAGLNPILAFGRGPNPTGFPPMARVPEFGQGLASTALSAAKIKSELKILERQEELIKQQGLKVEAERRNILSDPKKALFRTLLDPETRARALKKLQLTVDGVDTFGKKFQNVISEQWRSAAERWRNR